MSSRRRSGGHHEEEEEENSERWTTSYMDMVTVMMCLFIVLFAISQVDQDKFIELRQSLSAGFGDAAPAVTVLDGSSGVLDGGDAQPEDIAPVEGAEDMDLLVGNREEAREEAQALDAVRESIRTDLAEAGLEDAVRFAITERGLVIGLVSENTFFSPASAAMPRASLRVVDTIAATLRPLENDILLEGHANPLPYTEPYDTNWELSADRATKVLRRMVEHEGIAPTRVRAIGYGDAYPAADGPDSLDLNRRVDVVVLSDEPEAVRTLLPEVAHDMEGA
jgi:chemotaxis protein MotB